MAKKHGNIPKPPASAPGAASTASPQPPAQPPAEPPVTEGQTSASPDGASQQPDDQAQGQVQPPSSSTEGDPAKLAAAKNLNAPTSPKMRRYRVNWLFQGFREKDLQAGDLVEATEAEAAPFLGGVLSHEEEA